MGITYKAFDTNLRVTVALKVINATYLNSEVARQRFVREARAAARLSHPNVAGVFHLGEDVDAFFYAMEFIPGQTVEDRVKRGGPLPAAAALEIVLQVAKALRAAEREGLVHRDIKPANLMLVQDDDDSGDVIVKVIDFGLAKSAHKEAGDATVTIAGFVGTPHFASPEMLEERDLDVRSDIYALGVTLWWMLSGKPPFAGSLATIMRDHLQKAPPFEALAGQPVEVTALLRRMLEKDPAHRPQNATELRKEVEAAMRAINAADATATHFAGVGPASDSSFATQAFTTPGATSAASATTAGTMSSAPPPAVGMVLSRRYRLLRDCGEVPGGRLFLAQDVDHNRPVSVTVLHLALLATPDQQGKAERAFQAAKAVPHPGLTELYSLERSAEGHPLLVSEWINGFTLLDLLRGRSRLSAVDTLRLLEPVAAAADHAAQQGLDSLALGLSEVQVAFNAEYEIGSRPPFLGSPVAEWPEFHPKVMPVSLAEGANTATFAPEQTLVPGTRGGNGANAPADYPREIAALAFELLSGSPAPRVVPGQTARIQPLPTLSEAGNTALRRALHPGGFATASEFIATLKSGGGSGTGGTSAMSVIAPQPGPPPVLPGLPPTKTPPPPEVKSSSPVVPIIAVVAVIALGAGAYFFFGKKPIDPPLNPTPTPGPVVVATPVPTRAPELTPTPAIARVPTPTPGPVVEPKSRRELFQIALEEARKTESSGIPTEQLRAYLDLAGKFPEEEQAVSRLDRVIATITERATTPALRTQRFAQLRSMLESAADLGSESALMFLGEQLAENNSAKSYDYYIRAAEKGNTGAMIAVGQLVFKGGPGLSSRQTEAARWYQRASDKGDARAKVYLAECYREGKGGVAVDFFQSAALLNEALATRPDDPRALEGLAIAFEKGQGVKVDTRKAFELMERASDLGNNNAIGNLGTYYMRGLGLPRKDERKGAELFKRGADQDSGLCMFFYAQCLEGGLGVPKNPAEAQSYYRAAAERGIVPAREWCDRNRVPYTRR